MKSQPMDGKDWLQHTVADYVANTHPTEMAVVPQESPSRMMERMTAVKPKVGRLRFDGSTEYRKDAPAEQNSPIDTKSNSTGNHHDG